MMDIFLENGYWFMLLQVLITMLVFPILNFKRMRTITSGYSNAYYPEAQPEVTSYIRSKVKRLAMVNLVCFVLGVVIVLHALFNTNELLNWDNQAGLIVLCLIGFIPILANTLLQQGIFKIFKSHAGSKRSASLVAQKWQSYLSKPLMTLLFIGNVMFIVTVVYFSSNPFVGFAGYTNLLGLLILDAIFIGVFYTILTNRKMASIKDHTQREAIKKKAVTVNVIVWIVALFQLSASMWLAGLELKDYGLLLQSFYIQILLFLTAYSLSPAKLISRG